MVVYKFSYLPKSEHNVTKDCLSDRMKLVMESFELECKRHHLNESLYGTCILSSMAVHSDTAFIGMYSTLNHTFFFVEKIQQYISRFYIPMNISPGQASSLCLSLGHGWRMVKIKSFIELFLIMEQIKQINPGISVSY